MAAGLEVWVYNPADEHDPRLPHRYHPNRPVSQAHLTELGVLHSKVDVDELQNQGATLIDRTIRDFGYEYWEIVTLAPHLVENFKELTDKFFHEHLHPYDESRIILEGNGMYCTSPAQGAAFQCLLRKLTILTPDHLIDASKLVDVRLLGHP
ncbi:hypothetical protein L7F22_057130 [Adiantum nelumboides]|nr:hypothetical protein [Adiantum nelumboides]